ncbi:hypothetical protein ColLi_12513 [Colletotrichum liriopes]|uniref:Uncharacterized protein n=1 Tax=Colletotrichum liriopes TaxID=708192 RepID=A0AA37GYJ0_9PEZI|nr:hypothetical protein ColLi_12513 [Colletotrichum liriopes]
MPILSCKAPQRRLGIGRRPFEFTGMSAACRRKAPIGRRPAYHWGVAARVAVSSHSSFDQDLFLSKAVHSPTEVSIFRPGATAVVARDRALSPGGMRTRGHPRFGVYGTGDEGVQLLDTFRVG